MCVHACVPAYVQQLTLELLIGDEGTDGTSALLHGACDLGESQHSVEDVAGKELLGPTHHAVQLRAGDEP